MTVDLVATPTLPRLPGELEVRRLANGLTFCRLENRRAPIVTTALFYRAGTRDETPGRGGIAHFLEHMMFKGSGRYAAGDVDRRTQALGGSNNAFTSHEATAYHFNFASDRWTEALAIEADRMAALTLDSKEVASERQVILEEIAMYEGEPWDALEMAVEEKLFAGHPYGRPVLGTREELLASGGEDLAAFHRRLYRPDNAVLVVAGDVGKEALEAVEEAFGGLAGEGHRKPAPPPHRPPEDLVRLERRQGELPRLLLALPAPPADHPDHAAVRLATTVLAGGRTSRLHRALVDEGQLCGWVSSDVSETAGPGFTTVALELLPGVEPGTVEAELLRLLSELAATPPGTEEVTRAQQITVADWVFGHERIHQQALAAGFALTLFELGYAERQLARLLGLGPREVSDATARYLAPERGAVLGWSLPD
jgi:zinc protease